MSSQANSKFDSRIAANKEQLCERVQVDEELVRRHWASERALVSFIPPTARTILDLGCSPTGGMLMHAPDMQYVGLDFVYEYLADLRSRHSEIGPWEFSRRNWTCSTMETLPFPDASFDVVYSRHALEHTIDLDGAVSEIHRVLKPGGVFIFCVPARVDDTEPTHLVRWNARKWLKVFRRVGRIRFHAQHDYFIDELFGYVQKPGAPRKPLIGHIRRWVSYLKGQGILPDWLSPILRRVDCYLMRRLPE